MPDSPQDIIDTANKSATEIAQKVAAQASFDTLIIESLRTIREGVNRVEEKTDATSVRMDTLIDTTNHRLDDFRSAMDTHAKEMRAALSNKVDKTDLLTSVGFKLASLKPIRWGIGVLFAVITSTVLVQHWWEEILRFFGV